MTQQHNPDEAVKVFLATNELLSDPMAPSPTYAERAAFDELVMSHLRGDSRWINRP